ncbi:MAG TPA: DUF222 domain-containing protein [Kribbella sp.]|uniref:HNH endonuclease signature motif containing protein n=1 Tax=Kribbella sp. TaxID=1871183 RepID=UPI002D76665E|nr:DUF222 domain-containing protein [Kribbella sp.]HET6295046.1 DUF222 domain-containing protein [Kribbella sp.]
MEILGARPVYSMSGSEQLLTLDAARTEIARLQTLSLHLMAGLDESGHATELGAGDTVELLSLRHNLHPRDVRRDLTLAKALPKYPAVSAALPDPTDLDLDLDLDLDAEAAPCDRGTIRPAQAQVIIGALEKLPDTVPVEDIEVAEQELVKLAAHLNPVELRKAARHACDLLDTDGPEPAEDKAYNREALSLRDADHGVKFSGYLANENAELLRSLIHAGAKPHKTVDGELDPRSRDKRQADALTAVLNTAAGAASSPSFIDGDGPKANITITADLEDLRSGTGGAGIGDLVYGDGLSAAAIRRLACDAAITPLILGKNSVPLDVGWTKRFVTGHIRKALNYRDRGCVVCGAPPISCEAHHLIHWIDGGATKLCNLVLLCKRHHIALHAGRWTITLTDGIVDVQRPSWADPDPTTRIRYRPPPPDTPTGFTGDCPGSTTAPDAAAFDPWGDAPAATPAVGSSGWHHTDR